MKNTTQWPEEENHSKGRRNHRTERRQARPNLRAFEEQLRECQPPEPPLSIWNAIERRTQASPSRHSPRVMLAVAAALLVGLTILLVALLRPRQSETPDGSHRGAAPRAMSAELPGDAADTRDVSLVRINIIMSSDPDKLLDHLDACSRPLRGSEKMVSLLPGLNGA